MGFDFDAAVQAPFRMQPGLRRIAGAVRLTPVAPGDFACIEKLAVLEADWQRALLVAPAFDAAPALAAVAAHAAREHPDAWRGDCTSLAHAPRLGWSVRGDAVVGDGPAAIGDVLRALPAAWRAPALLALAFAEDFAIVDADSGSIPWLAVCLPSHWAPEDKIGRHFTEVHAPVADNRLLLAASDGLMRLVSGRDHWERFVWTLCPDARLDHHPRRSANAPWPRDAADLVFRSEHQSFIPVPGSRQAVFAIHVQTRPLTAVADTADRAQRLHAAVASMSDAVIAYRGLAEPRERLLMWLAARAASA